MSIMTFIPSMPSNAGSCDEPLYIATAACEFAEHGYPRPALTQEEVYIYL
jgi:hypothetical protein